MITTKEHSPNKSPKKPTKEDLLSKHHLQAQTFIDCKNYPKAISCLLTIIQTNPTYSKEIYIETAKCFIESNDYQTAARQLTRCLLNFPQFAEGFLNRGLVHNRLQQWEKAIFDFTEALGLCKTLGPAYLGLANALAGLGDLENAVKVLENGVKCPESFLDALVSKGKILFEMREFGRALADFERLIETQPDNSEAYYFKGLCLLALQNSFDAVVALEQVIKHDSQNLYTGAAIYNLGAIKIKQKDFFGAFSAFKRANDLGVALPEQKIVQQYVEAVLFLIKRNFSSAVKLLTRIITKKDKLLEEYIGNCLEYRAYAYAFMNFHSKAVKDLQEAKKIQELEKASFYNLCVSEGILGGNTANRIEKFNQALETFNNPEPFVYKSAVLFKESVSLGVKAEESKKLLDSALKIRENDSEIFFFRAIVLYYNNKTVEAIYDLEKAIEKAEDNLPKQFLARGCCSARLKVYKEAVEEFSMAVKLDKNEPLGYFYRGRCFFLMGEVENAHEDFKVCMKMRNGFEKDFFVFLLHAGMFEEALRVAEDQCVERFCVERVLGKVFCYIFLGKIDFVIRELKSCYSIQKSSEIEIDLLIFQLIKNLSTEGQEHIPHFLNQIQNLNTKTGTICTALHKTWLTAVAHMYQGNFIQARHEFESIIRKPNKKAKSIERNTAELIYNLALCYLLEEKYFEALFQLLDICNFLHDSDKGKVLFLVSMIKNVLGSVREAKMFLSEAFKLNQVTVKAYTEGNSDLKLQPLDSNSEFLQKFLFFSLKFADFKVLVKPSISLPRPTLKSLEFDMEDEILQLFGVEKVNCKPETPYLNRVGGVIQFTEMVQDWKSDSDSDCVECESSGSRFFSSNSLIMERSLEIVEKTGEVNKNFEDYDSSLSGILDEIED